MSQYLCDFFVKDFFRSEDVRAKLARFIRTMPWIEIFHDLKEILFLVGRGIARGGVICGVQKVEYGVCAFVCLLNCSQFLPQLLQKWLPPCCNGLLVP